MLFERELVCKMKFCTRDVTDYLPSKGTAARKVLKGE